MDSPGAGAYAVTAPFVPTDATLKRLRIVQHPDGSIKWGTVWTTVMALVLAAAAVGFFTYALAFSRKAVATVQGSNGVRAAIGEGQTTDRRQDQELVELRRIAQTHSALLSQFDTFMIRDEKWKTEIATALARIAAKK